VVAYIADKQPLKGIYMKKIISVIAAICPIFLFSGCNTIGSKSASLSVIYIATAVLSLLLLFGYCILLKKKDPWFVLLFSSVFIVNTGYLLLSMSKTLNFALFANRISYLGSVMLPLSILIIILNVTNLKYSKHLLWVLVPITVFVFLVAASPGYIDIYYKSVTLGNINGVSVLIKEYGPWHKIYLFYLLGYFLVMIAVIIHSKVKKRIESPAHSAILLIAVFVNICVWLLEQLVDIEFEFLSVSYIISELFLLSLHLVIQDNTNRLNHEKELRLQQEAKIIRPSADITNSSAEFAEHCKYLSENLHTLTPTEKTIYGLYIDGKGTRDIMKELGITENTLKYHNKNIYSKLGVSSRKQLIEYARAIQKAE